MYPLPPVQALPGNQDRMTRFLELIDGLANRRIVVIGDVIADEFISGRISRVSREAPVLILSYDSTQIVPGGAGNAANNVATLGGRIDIFGLIGRDEAGRRTVAGFAPGVNSKGLVKLPKHLTPTKTRILAGGAHSAKQQVVRIDRVPTLNLDAAVHRSFSRAVLRAVRDCDGVIFSDYGSGLVTSTLAASVLKAVHGRSKRRRPIPVLIDSRYNLLAFKGFTACTPNESEVEALLDVHIDDDAVLKRAGRALLKRTQMASVLVTRGSRGMVLFEKSKPAVEIPIFGTDEIADVTGAGDTVIATITLALTAGASIYEAARLANYAGGIVVTKRGTATVSSDELRAAIKSDHDFSSG